MFKLPKTYKQGMEEIVIWANELPEEDAKRFMLDIYKTYIDWKYLLETIDTELQIEGKDNSEEYRVDL